MVLVIDNYDSFTYNLVQMIGQDVTVKRNDETSISQIKNLNPTHIILSPGPGRPKDAGICEDIITSIDDIPILGVCLGHQAICEAFGGDVLYAKELMHGKSSLIDIDTDNKLFAGLPTQILVGRYHSLIGDNVPECLEVIGKTDSGEIMAIQHQTRHIYGVQFHPESILTKDGHTIIQNFLEV